MPDLSADPSNLDFNLCKLMGCQFIGMCWQNFDSNCEIAAQYFDDNGSACVVKDPSLRMVTAEPKTQVSSSNVNFQPGSVSATNGSKIPL